MLGALAIIWFGFHVLSGGVFLTPRNLWNLSVQTASIAVMSTGMVLVIVTRNIDLSVGAILGFAGMILGVVQAQLLPGLLGFGHPLTRPRGARRARRRRADRPLPGRADRLSRHPLLHRHPRRPARLARRGLVGDHGPDRRAHGHALQGAGRRRRGRDRLHRHLGHRGAGLRPHPDRARVRPPAAAAFRLSRPPALGGGRRRRAGLRRRRRGGGGRQRLSPSRRRGAPARRGAGARLARGRPPDSSRLRGARPDRHPGRHRDELPRQAPALRALRLRHRRQPGGGRAVRHPDPPDADPRLRAHGRALRHLGLHLDRAPQRRHQRGRHPGRALRDRRRRDRGHVARRRRRHYRRRDARRAGDAVPPVGHGADGRRHAPAEHRGRRGARPAVWLDGVYRKRIG